MKSADRFAAHARQRLRSYCRNGLVQQSLRVLLCHQRPFGDVFVTLVISTTSRQQVSNSAGRLVTHLCTSQLRRCFSHNNNDVQYCVLTCIDGGMFFHAQHLARGMSEGRFAWEVDGVRGIKAHRADESQWY